MFDRKDRYFLLTTVVVPLILWWMFFGKDKYSLKGQR